MRKLFSVVLLSLYAIPLYSQEIVNLVLVGKNGITEDVKEAHSFVLVKKYPQFFQRLDYTMRGPLVKLRSYSDSSLSVLQGPYYEYDPGGSLLKSGYYSANMKEKVWYYYNDTGKVILEEKYERGILVKTTDPDTVKQNLIPDTLRTIEIEAQYKKGGRDWIKYLQENLKADVALQSVRGGTVIVSFVVSTQGKCVDVHLARSVEFVLDEEAIRVIEQSSLWEPAVQNGRKVNAYRRQPISFAKGE